MIPRTLTAFNPHAHREEQALTRGRMPRGESVTPPGGMPSILNTFYPGIVEADFPDPAFAHKQIVAMIFVGLCEINHIPKRSGIASRRGDASVRVLQRVRVAEVDVPRPVLTLNRMDIGDKPESGVIFALPHAIGKHQPGAALAHLVESVLHRHGLLSRQTR